MSAFKDYQTVMLSTATHRIAEDVLPLVNQLVSGAPTEPQREKLVEANVHLLAAHRILAELNQ